MTCPRCGYCEHCKRLPENPGRWQCGICGAWVTFGAVHACAIMPGTGTTPLPPFPSYPTYSYTSISYAPVDLETLP